MNERADQRYRLDHRVERQLRCFYLPRQDAPAGVRDEQLSWACFTVASPSFETCLVLVAASIELWASGPAAIRNGLLLLMRAFAAEPGWTAPVERDRPAANRSAIWILQTPDRSYQLVRQNGPSRPVAWAPLFSVDPQRKVGSVQALRLLFPVHADEGIAALEQYFWSASSRV